MLRIASIEAVPLEASFARHFGGAARIPAHVLRPASHFQAIPRNGQFSTVVVARTTTGLCGYGEAFGLPHPVPAAAFIEQVVAPVLVGAALDIPSTMLATIRAYLHALGQTRGVAAEALSGVDIALWDLLAKAQGVALAELLGGMPRPVPLYASPIPFMAVPDETAAAAAALVEEGFSGVKLKIGRGIDTDLAHIRAARDTIGPKTGLMLDANCAYDAETAISLARRLEPYAIAWLEEPIPPGDNAALARIRTSAPVRLASGENAFTPEEIVEMARAGAVDIVQPNITRAGGVTGLLAIDVACREHGLALAPHGVGGAVGIAALLHAAAVCDTLTLFEANRLPNALRDRLPRRPPVLTGGALLPPSGPGHGGDPDPATLASYRWCPSGRSP